MSRIEKYVNNVLNQTNLQKKEKHELKIQFNDHINSLKEEHMKNGLEENEAVSLAIKEFNGESQLSYSLTPKDELKGIVKKIILILFYLYMFVLLGHYLKLAGDSGTIRFVISCLIPFKYISSLIKNVSRYGYNINNLDYIITYFVAFIPVGFFIPLVSNNLNTFKRNFLIYLTLVIGIIFVRIIFNLGLVFIDHGIMHLAGCIIGYNIYRITIRCKIKEVLFVLNR